MNHVPEIPHSTEPRTPGPAAVQARETAAAYARLFSTDDGQRVLRDLSIKFGHDRPRFSRAAPRHDTVTAALIDGECAVLREIENAIGAGLKQSTQPN